MKTPLFKMLLLAVIVLALDLWSKHWILGHFALGESRAFGRFFSLTYVQNTGTAFGLFQNRNYLFVLVSVTVMGVLLYHAWDLYAQAGRWALIGVGLVMGGAVGNLIDRIRFGSVVDFFDFHFWPVFNVADSAITVGTALLFIGLSFSNRHHASHSR